MWQLARVSERRLHKLRRNETRAFAFGFDSKGCQHIWKPEPSSLGEPSSVDLRPAVGRSQLASYNTEPERAGVRVRHGAYNCVGLQFAPPQSKQPDSERRRLISPAPACAGRPLYGVVPTPYRRVRDRCSGIAVLADGIRPDPLPLAAARSHPR